MCVCVCVRCDVKLFSCLRIIVLIFIHLHLFSIHCLNMFQYFVHLKQDRFMLSIVISDNLLSWCVLPLPIVATLVNSVSIFEVHVTWQFTLFQFQNCCRWWTGNCSCKCWTEFNRGYFQFNLKYLKIWHITSTSCSLFL